VFWKSGVQTWMLYNKKPNFANPGSDCLWNNPNITYQGNVVFFKNWAKGGFTYVSDLVKDNDILPFPEISRKLDYSPNLYLEYIVVHSALRIYMQKHGQSNFSSDPHVDLCFNGLNLYTAKAFRQHMVKEKYIAPTGVRFWQNKFGFEISSAHWELAPLVTRETRLR
jgi:hypothetical protein